MSAEPTAAAEPSDAADAATVDAADLDLLDGEAATVTEAPSDNTTLVAVLSELEQRGYEASFGSRPGAVIACSACRTDSPAATFDVAVVRRLEGASDPSAETIVIAATCPSCGARGTAALGYGPEAGSDDAMVVADLEIDAATDAPT